MRTSQAKYILTLATLLQAFALSPALAGGEGNVGGGTDQLPSDTGSAWFTGRQNEIKYCVVADPDFGVSAEVAERKFVEAFGQWEKYLWSILSEYHNITTKLARQPECTGSEDLMLYFGASGDEVVKEKVRYFNPIGIAHRTQFDDHKGWGKGFIWIASGSTINVNWGFGNNLLGILLHEIGHVYGCSHVDGTIMRESNGNLLGDGDDEKKYVESKQRLLGQIDGERQLFLHDGRNFDFSGNLAYGYDKGYNRPDTTPVELERIAKTFLKRPIQGTALARVRGTNYTNQGSYRSYQYFLSITDDAGTVNVTITFSENPDWADRNFETRFDRQGKIFFTVGTGAGLLFSSMGMWAYGTADLGDGRTLPIILEQNMNSILALKYIDADGIHNLFKTSH